MYVGRNVSSIFCVLIIFGLWVAADEPSMEELLKEDELKPKVFAHSDSLFKVFKVLSSEVDDKLKWSKADKALKKLNPRDFSLLYSLDTVESLIQTREKIRKAKDYYDNSTSSVLTWCSYAENPINYLLKKLSAAADNNSCDKLALILNKLFLSGKMNLGKGLDALKESQQAMSEAQRHFDKFMMDKKKEDEARAAKAARAVKADSGDKKNKSEAWYNQLEAIVKTIKDHLETLIAKLSTETADFDPSTINYAEELKDKVNLLPKINELRTACSKYKSKHLQSSSKNTIAHNASP